ncbi:MAG: beta-galactosidase [Eubacteriales bacterium]|nr:beta-galactosidase [Eubacteriales bacterium]
MGRLIIHKDKLELDGRDFYLASGDFHYFRCLPGGWRRRLKLMKDFGLTAVQTYVPWNLHEPSPGQFDFTGRLDLGAFIRLAAEEELKVLLRPSPYMCGEWDLGGLPAWLLKDRTICLRSSDPRFLDPVRSYTRRLCQEFVPTLSTRGGPVILVAVENEYGSYGDDLTYLDQLRAMLVDFGVDVPFFSANGHDIIKLKNGNGPGTWAGVDFRLESRQAIERLRAYQPDMPPLVTEFWSGRSITWGSAFKPRDPVPVARAYREALDLGAYVNFYMFCGGTNFGFMSGANIGRHFGEPSTVPEHYVAETTSYDADALVSENGIPTEKYYACQHQLDQYLGRARRPDNPPRYQAQVIGPVTMQRVASLFGELERLSSRCVHAANCLAMEDLDQAYGFILYTTRLTCTDNRRRYLRMEGLRDRAQVYGNGHLIGTVERDQADNDRAICFMIPPGGLQLDILVENQGRIKYGWALTDRKGILQCVRMDIEEPGNRGFLYNKAMIMNWVIRTLPLSDISGLPDVLSKDGPDRLPAFYRGSFAARPGVDTFLSLPGWKKGVAWVNGFNLGRYWSVGPQHTLYVPGELLNEENTLHVFELLEAGPGCQACLGDSPIMT